MRYLIPFNTKIIPYSLKKEIKGSPRQIPTNASFESSDVLRTLRMVDPDQRKVVEYYCLPLASNNPNYDSFLVSSEDIIDD